MICTPNAGHPVLGVHISRMALFLLWWDVRLTVSPSVKIYDFATSLVSGRLFHKAPSDEGAVSGSAADWGREPYRHPRRMWMAKPPYSPAR